MCSIQIHVATHVPTQPNPRYRLNNQAAMLLGTFIRLATAMQPFAQFSQLHMITVVHYMNDITEFAWQSSLARVKGLFALRAWIENVWLALVDHCQL